MTRKLLLRVVICLAVLAMAFLAVPADGVEIIFQNGLANALYTDGGADPNYGYYQGIQDTFVNSNYVSTYYETDKTTMKNSNFGNDQWIVVGDEAGDTRASLIKFDISELATLGDATHYVKVDSAVFSVYCRPTSYGLGEGEFMQVQVSYCSDADADWIEGTGDGRNPAGMYVPGSHPLDFTLEVAGDINSGQGTAETLAGEVTWNYKGHYLNRWSIDPGDGVGVIDALYDSAALLIGYDDGLNHEDPNLTDPNDLTIIDCTTSDPYVEDFVTATLDPERVQDWIYDSDYNGGLVLTQANPGEGSYCLFASSEQGNYGIYYYTSPILTINYTITEIGCGDPGAVYLDADLTGPVGDRDCVVDRYDLAAFVSDWLNCTDPTDSRCGWVE